jgi:hypothetical protein
LPIADCRLPIHGLSIADWRFTLPIVDLIGDWRFTLSIGDSHCRLPIHIADWRFTLPIADWLFISSIADNRGYHGHEYNRQSPIQSAIPQPPIQSAIVNPNRQSPIVNL